MRLRQDWMSQATVRKQEGAGNNQLRPLTRKRKNDGIFLFGWATGKRFWKVVGLKNLER
jgi:hypothetical protein